jgi:D-alanine transaminase
MSEVYFNGQFMALEEVKISPLDRGFLFGDGVYEVIPCENDQLIGMGLHLQRLYRSLSAIRLTIPLEEDDWRAIFQRLLQQCPNSNSTLYVQISRGVQSRRNHVATETIIPTIFVMLTPSTQPSCSKGLSVFTQLDSRWQRCDIKSTALLANIMYMEQAKQNHADEVILFDQQDQITEGASSNVFIVANNKIRTPSLAHNILPGVTRQLVLNMLSEQALYEFEETTITKCELEAADEIWLTSSSKNIAPVVLLDDKMISQGRPGEIWKQVSKQFEQYKLNNQ